MKHGAVPEVEPGRSQVLLLYKCKICTTQLASRSELKLHTSQEHALDIEDLEAMVVTDLEVEIKDEINNKKIVSETKERGN